MAKKAKKSKIIWAFDPFSQEEKSHKVTADVVREFNSPRVLPVEPVYVLGPVGLNWSGDFNVPWVDDFKTALKEKLKTTLSAIDLPGKQEAKILINREGSRRKDVKALLSYARREKAELIVINTHARKGLELMVMGSFAFELILTSNIPVLTINPAIQQARPIRKILFPTDLQSSSKLAFKKILSLAKSKNAEVEIFYKVVDAINPYLQSGTVLAGGGWVSIEKYLENEYQRSESGLKKLVEQAKAQGVKATYQLSRSPSPIADDILAYAKTSQPDLICLNSKGGPISSVILGSVARELIRRAETPVWVIHTKSS